MSSEFKTLIEDALNNRKAFFENMSGENTDCYRLFHGVAEGYPGLTVDRYGTQIIVQTFRTDLDTDSVKNIFHTVEEYFDARFSLFYNHREGKFPKPVIEPEGETKDICFERGIKFVTQGNHGGLDPLHFLDLRAGRNYIQSNCQNKSFLNLFSYTCSAGVVAVAGGASEVWNIDFSRKWLSYGKENLLLNNYDMRDMKLIKEDFFPVTRQLSGLGMRGRARKIKYTKLMPKKFDMVLLDPPTYTKSKFFSVDIVGDYQSLFKPSLLSLKKGGEIICTNHSALVDYDEWIDALKSCAEKAEMPLKSIRQIEPDPDFPSFDGKFPLKIAICSTYE